MPALPPIANVARVTVNATLGGLPYANVFHHKWLTASQSTTSMNAIAALYRSTYVAQILPVLANTFILTTVSVQDLTTPSGPSGIATGSTPGTGSGSVYPNNVAMCVSWKIDRHYRGGKPRTYFAGFLYPNQVDQAHWSTTILTTMNTKMTAFFAALQSPSIVDIGVNGIGCVHYVRDKHPLTTPDFDSFTGFSIDSRIDTQRRRLGRH